MEEIVVLYPFCLMGHFAPMMELAKLFRRYGFNVVVVLANDSTNKPFAPMEPFIARVSAADPSISFHHLPPIPAEKTPNYDKIFRRNNPSLCEFLASSSSSQNLSVRAVVLDFFSTGALDVAAELGLPSYIFFSSCAGVLAAFLYLPTLVSQCNLQDLGDAPIDFPGLLPMRASDLPAEIIDPENELGKGALYHFDRLANSHGILVNSFESLEPRALNALRNGVCVPGRGMPPVYFIGPLITEAASSEGEIEDKHESIAWLDAQPRGSVVFLCFGSLGTFKAEQLKEIATGLERSGQRFLWVERTGQKEGSFSVVEGLPRTHLEALLPEGFMERTRERGRVVTSWAPQQEVLRHEAVGAFVSHCGWNSSLESIVNGKPVIGWPLYAEQRMNKVFLVEEMRLAVAMEGYDKKLVAAEEVEGKIRWLMESEGGRELNERTAAAAKERASAAKESAAKAWREGGSSYEAWLELVNILRN